MITVQNISKYYQTQAAVEAVSFEIERGQTLCLIGSSGSGKTTTLKMLNRLIESSSGKITIDGQNIQSINIFQLRRKIGYVIQQGGLFPHMTVADNIGLILRLEKWSAPKIKHRVEELLELVQLPFQEYAHRYPSELSGGQQQRVGISRALALRPPIILMDEPFGALDPMTRTQVQDGFLEIQQKLEITTIMVTHNMAEAFKFGDKIALMNAGKIIQMGPPLALINHPNSDFVSDFVHSQAGLEQLLDLPVGRLAEPWKDYQKAWPLTAQGQIKGYLDPSGTLHTSPHLTPKTPLKAALKLLLGTQLPGLPVVDSKGLIAGIIRTEELKKLL